MRINQVNRDGFLYMGGGDIGAGRYLCFRHNVTSFSAKIGLQDDAELN